MHRRNGFRIALACLAAALTVSGACVAGQTADTFDPAFPAEALDLAQCKQFVDGVEAPVQPKQVLAALGFKPGAAWELGHAKDQRQLITQYLLVLAAPAQVGGISLSAPEPEGLVSRTLYYLKADVATPDVNKEADWIPFPPMTGQSAAAFFTLPVGTKSRAFRVTDIRKEHTSAIECWRFYKHRLHNDTPDATGIGERGSFCTHAGAVPKGQFWQNAALDPDPTSKATRILRPPVTDVAPSWFILSWDQPRALSGLFMHTNAMQYKVYSYIGDPRVNPALGGPDDWARVSYAIASEDTNERNKTVPYARWLAFAPTKTQALKIMVFECAPKGNMVFSLASFAALSDLAEAPAPAPRTDSLAYHFNYALAQSGETALAIKTLDGQHVCNLFAQEERATGEHSQIWDLKDDQGRSVPPGTYKWEAINAPPVELHYQMTVTPNIEARSTERTPWYQDMSGPHGWMADHAMATTCTTLGDKTYFGAPGVEGGTSFIECDLNGVKQWGKVNFGAWTGVAHLASDGSGILIHAGNTVYRMEPATHEIRELIPANTPERKGYLQSITGGAGKLYMARSSPIPFIDNAIMEWQVDLEHCLPFYTKDVRGNFRTQPNPRVDFLRALRLTGTPPGQAQSPNDRPAQHWPVYLESTQGTGRRQFVMVSFKEPQSIGSVVFPHPGGKTNIRFSTLKATAPYPPNASREADWTPFEQHGKPGWDCVAAPPNTTTRALRITFSQPGDEMDDLVEGPGENPSLKPGEKSGVNDLFAAGNDKKDDAPAKGWFGRLEGLKILRRRLQNLYSTAKVRVNSGTLAADGVWDAKRTEAVTPEKPGIYLMEWDAPQDLAGLAFKEIDGSKTEIDIWTGAEAGAIPLEGTAGWKHISTYEQARRLYYEPDFNRNDQARYMDGYVNFDTAQKTRAVRLRVVAQWMEDAHYPHGLRADMGGRTLDPRRCRIFGVAPLASIGGEPPLDSRVYQGLDIVDTKSGKLQETVQCDPGYSLAINAAGDICTLRDYGIQKLDLKTGKSTAVVQGLKSPERLTTSPDGNYYVFCGHDGGSIIHVFDKDGKPVRDIGHPGSLQPGLWDPQRLSNVNDLCVDKSGSLWVMDTDDQPRRTIQFKTDGTFVQEMLGNAHYGGGGTLNRYDLNRAYLGRVEFEIDWPKRTAKVHGLLADKVYADELLAVRIKDRLYLTSAPLSYSAQQPVGVVYLYNEATGTARLAAAFGDAVHFEPIFQPAIIAAMNGKTPTSFKFLWSDRNGDGKVELAEVQLEEKKSDGEAIRAGRFDSELGNVGSDGLYTVKEFLPDGTPIYEKKALPAPGMYRIGGGRIFGLDTKSSVYKTGENSMYSPDGKRLWGYPSDHPSVSGLWLPPWRPGYVTNQFAIIGHETARAGDLGEFLVVDANNGQWNIWTADGFLAGHLTYHALDKRAHNFGPLTSPLGARLDPLTCGQEHFHGFFTQSEKDGRSFMIAGGNWMSVIEVNGLERYKRTKGEIKITSEDIQRARTWESEQTRKEILTSVPMIDCRRSPTIPRIDGTSGENEWAEPSAKLDEVSFNMAFDANNLYLSFSGLEPGSLKNSGTEFQRYFKTGAALDLHLATDPKADPVREKPAAGDIRVLMTFVQDKPRVVLYQPICPGAKPDEAWETFTAVAGKSHFDRVVILDKAQLAANVDKGGHLFVEAALPLKDLGLKITPNLQLKMDWGILFSREGNQTQSRAYWTNAMANGTSDESFESRLEPHLWGYVRFPVGNPGTKSLPGLDREDKKGGDILDILER